MLITYDSAYFFRLRLDFLLLDKRLRLYFYQEGLSYVLRRFQNLPQQVVDIGQTESEKFFRPRNQLLSLLDDIFFNHGTDKQTGKVQDLQNRLNAARRCLLVLIKVMTQDGTTIRGAYPCYPVTSFSPSKIILSPS